FDQWEVSRSGAPTAEQTAAANLEEEDGADAPVQVSRRVLPGIDVVKATWRQPQPDGTDEELQFFKHGALAGVDDHIQAPDSKSAHWSFSALSKGGGAHDPSMAQVESFYDQNP